MIVRKQGLEETPHVFRYAVFYLIMAVLEIAAVLFLIPAFHAFLHWLFPSFSLSLWWVDKSAMKSVIGLVGTTGLAVAWLISILPQKVHGIRIVELVRWSGPGFFRFYFWGFLPTLMIGTFAANLSGDHGRATTLISFVWVIAGTLLLVYKCKEFVFKYPRREIIAFSYYHFIFDRLCSEEQPETEQHSEEQPETEQHSEEQPETEQHSEEQPETEQHSEEQSETEQRSEEQPETEQHSEEQPETEQHSEEQSETEQRSEEQSESFVSKYLPPLLRDSASRFWAMLRNRKHPRELDIESMTVEERLHLCEEYLFYLAGNLADNLRSGTDLNEEALADLISCAFRSYRSLWKKKSADDQEQDIQCAFLAMHFWEIVLHKDFSKIQRARVIAALAGQSSNNELLIGLILEVYRQAELVCHEVNPVSQRFSDELWVNLGEQISVWCAEAEINADANPKWLQKIYVMYIWLMMLDNSCCYREAGGSYIQRLLTRLEGSGKSAVTIDELLAAEWKNHDKQMVQMILGQTEVDKLLVELANAHLQILCGQRCFEQIKEQVSSGLRRDDPECGDSTFQSMIPCFIKLYWKGFFFQESSQEVNNGTGK